MAGYRWVVIVAAAGSAVLCAFAIYFNVMALAKYRTDDFLEATATKDFTRKGTCVETITVEQLQAYDYNTVLDSVDNNCPDDGEKGKRLEMQRTLAVSVHGLYYLYFTKGVSDDLTRGVVETAISATIGGAKGLAVTPASVNFSAAYHALSAIPEQGVPVLDGCNTIYGLQGESAITDADAVSYYAKLRAGRLDDDGKEHSDWPIEDIDVRCNNGPASTPSGAGLVDVTSALDAEQTQMLYAHCLAQFYFASSGTIPYGGTFGVPLVGERPGPNDFWYPNAAGFNSTSDYNTKVRMFLGQRFGYSVWAYVPMLLASCYLCADAVVYFLAEATLPDVLLETQENGGSRRSMMRDSLVMASTSRVARGVRFGIGFAAVFASYLFYGLFVYVPWGLVETKMPRPHCETGDPEHLELAEVNWRGTHGGWKADWDAGWYELATLLFQGIVFLVLPFTTANVFAICNRGGRSQTAPDRLITSASAAAEIPELVEAKPQQRRLMGLFVLPLFAGIVVLIGGQAISGARFGMAWAEGVVGQATHTDETTGEVSPAFNEVTLSEQVYDQTISTVAITVALGFLLGAVLQRHLINGAGCYSAMLFFGWVILVAFFALPLLVYASLRSVFNQDEANQDCAAFPDSGYDWSKFACEARFYSFIAGGILVLITLGLMTFFGLLEALPNIIRVRSKAAVRRRALRGNHAAFYEGAGNYATGSYQDQAGFEGDKHLLGGFRSADESFFNYKTSVSAVDTGEANALLYAPRVTFTLPSAMPTKR